MLQAYKNIARKRLFSAMEIFKTKLFHIMDHKK